MPSADDLIADVDQPEGAPAAEPDLDSWPVFATSSNDKKKRKSKKKNVAARNIAEVENEEVFPPEPTTIAASPPTEHVVDLQANPSAPQTLANAPLLPGFDDRGAAVEDVAPSSPKPLPSRPSPASSPLVRSPRPAAARPIPPQSPPVRPASLYGSYDRPNPMATYRQNSQPRRESLVNASSPRGRFVEPPPPHLPQAHFFTLPDLGFGFGEKQESGKPAGSDGYCCSLDSLADAGDGASARKARDALLVGSEGGLDVFRILPNKLEVVGRLEGLRGAVIGAKILPHVERHDSIQHMRPLIALIIHGPTSDVQGDIDHEGEPYEVTERRGAASRYQTTVEIYSLQTQQHVTTLYESTPTVHPNITQTPPSVIEIDDNLHLSAEGRFITVSSGRSGEVFVFTAIRDDGVVPPEFRCIGKFWTSLQTSTSRPTSTGESVASTAQGKDDATKPLLSLSQRWLAIVPPSSSNISDQGIPHLSDLYPSPPGISAHVAPPQPLITCEVVGTDVEGAWSRLGRQAAQGLMKYSAKGIEMGLQGWKELTHPSSPSPGRHDRTSSKEDIFPPTKGPQEDPSRLAREPALVSIIDLENLIHWERHKPKHFPPPMATFALVDGCNFVSLSETGTQILTSSRKGEVSTVWDLAQVAHGIPKRGIVLDPESSCSPCIKQLHRITRNSPSTVLECAWSRDDTAIALLTAHGTVHLHEIPRDPNANKRKRRSTAEAPAEKAEATVGLSAGQSPPSSNQGFLGSLKSGWQTMSTQVSSITSSNPAATFGLPTTFAGFREATAAAGSAGSRAVAKGLSQGYTVAKGGASDYWHADDNKIRHKPLQDLTSSSSIRWMSRPDAPSLAIACGGVVHVHSVQRVSRRKGDDLISGLKHERYAKKNFPLPPITTRSETATAPSRRSDCIGQGPHGFWSLRHSTPPPTSVRRSGSPTTKLRHGSTNDVETNPPYCPFHADPRVNIFAFGENDQGSQLGLHGSSASFEDFRVRGHALNEAPWTFGGPIPASVKMNEHVADELSSDGLGVAGDEDDQDGDGDLASQVESRLTIQPAHASEGGGEIRINTRRRHGRSGAAEGGVRHSDAFGVLEEDADDDFHDDMRVV